MRGWQAKLAPVVVAVTLLGTQWIGTPPAGATEQLTQQECFDGRTLAVGALLFDVRPTVGIPECFFNFTCCDPGTTATGIEGAASGTGHYGVNLTVSDRLGEIIDLGVKAGVIEKSGSWFSYNSQRIGQGRDNVREFLKANPDMADEIEQAVRASSTKIEEELLVGGPVEGEEG